MTAVRVTLRTYATLCRHIPGASAGAPMPIELPGGATLKELIEGVAIPADEVKVAFVNGRTEEIDRVLQEGDEVGLFPPVGGG